jgi:hypothetical protein
VYSRRLSLAEPLLCVHPLLLLAYPPLTTAPCSQAITPVRSITYKDASGEEKKVVIGDGENAGPRTLELLAELTGIQSGVREDKLGFTWPKEGVDVAKATK